jgi:hypothetical protein
MKEGSAKKDYGKFGGMIATATLVMFALTYLNTYELGHVSFSETRVFMALLMGATMASLMLLFMLGMYRNWKVNIAIFAGSAAVFLLALWLVRSQRTVDDVSWMKAMIPHHSIAILTSERAQISDPRVRDLADQIIESQRREIAEMKMLVKELENGGSDPRMHAKHEALPLYIVDFGSMAIREEPRPIRNTGNSWQVILSGEKLRGHPPAGLKAPVSELKRELAAR